MAQPRREGTRTNNPANTRSRVLDAAAALFRRKGYAETSMHDIMQAAEVTSGALHHHYRTKKDLGLAVIRERVAGMVEEAWIDPIIQTGDVGTGVTHAFQRIIDGLTEGAIVGCPLNNLALELAFAEPEFRTEIHRIFDHWQRALSQRITETRLLGENSEISPEELATLIVASYSGAMTMAKTTQTARPLNDTLKMLTRFLRSADARG